MGKAKKPARSGGGNHRGMAERVGKLPGKKAAALLRISARMHDAFIATVEPELEAARLGDEGLAAHEFLSAVLMALASSAAAYIAGFAQDQSSASVVADEFSEMVHYKTRAVVNAIDEIRLAKIRGLQ